MDTQKLLSYLRQCIKTYQMIEEGDHIAVGLSGGKDSMTLLYGLKKLQSFYPVPFTLSAIHVNLGIEPSDQNSRLLKNYCDRLGVPYHEVKTQIYPIVFQARKEKNPCSLCSKMRKGALNEKALSLSCNKVAYAHHKDDFIETSMMSLFYNGNYDCFPPVTRLERTGLTVIRPMFYISEWEIKSYQHKNGIPVLDSQCPADGNTKREEMKHFLNDCAEQFPALKKHLHTALKSYYTICLNSNHYFSSQEGSSGSEGNPWE